jgi:hypothetical protein
MKESTLKSQHFRLFWLCECLLPPPKPINYFFDIVVFPGHIYFKLLSINIQKYLFIVFTDFVVVVCNKTEQSSNWTKAKQLNSGVMLCYYIYSLLSSRSCLPSCSHWWATDFPKISCLISVLRRIVFRTTRSPHLQQGLNMFTFLISSLTLVLIVKQLNLQLYQMRSVQAGGPFCLGIGKQLCINVTDKLIILIGTLIVTTSSTYHLRFLYFIHVDW